MFIGEVIGNLGADAQVKSANGRSFVTFRVANTDRYTDQQGNVKESTDWIDCVYSDTESKVLPYLKQGVKVYVRGRQSLRVYSSKKERAMKAGATIHVMQLELCGGTAESVPRRLIVPETGQVVDVKKFYRANVDTNVLKTGEVAILLDEQNRSYCVEKSTEVYPMPDEQPGTTESDTARE